MIVISGKQWNEFDAAVARHNKQEFAWRLRRDYPDRTSEMDDGALSKFVDEGYENALELEIFEREDVYRFLKLFFLPTETLESPYFQSVLIRVLNNLNVTGAARLNLIERQVIGRDAPDRQESGEPVGDEGSAGAHTRE